MITGGSLRSYVKKIKNPRLRVIKGWGIEILSGLLYLHEQKPHPIIHRDLKCDNIFINSHSGEIRIGDLGLSTPMQNSFTTSVLGTPEFMAPELYEECYGTSVDIYAFGMCMLEMITLERPYKECQNVAQIYNKVIQGIRPLALERIEDEEVKDFIFQCLNPAEKRPSARDLLESKFLNDLDSEKNNREVKVLPPIKQKKRKNSLQYLKKHGNTIIEEVDENSEEDDDQRKTKIGGMSVTQRCDAQMNNQNCQSHQDHQTDPQSVSLNQDFRDQNKANDNFDQSNTNSNLNQQLEQASEGQQNSVSDISLQNSSLTTAQQQALKKKMKNCSKNKRLDESISFLNQIDEEKQKKLQERTMRFDQQYVENDESSNASINNDQNQDQDDDQDANNERVAEPEENILQELIQEDLELEKQEYEREQQRLLQEQIERVRQEEEEERQMQALLLEQQQFEEQQRQQEVLRQQQEQLRIQEQLRFQEQLRQQEIQKQQELQRQQELQLHKQQEIQRQIDFQKQQELLRQQEIQKQQELARQQEIQRQQQEAKRQQALVQKQNELLQQQQQQYQQQWISQPTVIQEIGLPSLTNLAAQSHTPVSNTPLTQKQSTLQTAQEDPNKDFSQAKQDLSPAISQQQPQTVNQNFQQNQLQNQTSINLPDKPIANSNQANRSSQGNLKNTKEPRKNTGEREKEREKKDTTQIVKTKTFKEDVSPTPSQSSKNLAIQKQPTATTNINKPPTQEKHTPGGLVPGTTSDDLKKPVAKDFGQHSDTNGTIKHVHSQIKPQLDRNQIQVSQKHLQTQNSDVQRQNGYSSQQNQAYQFNHLNQNSDSHHSNHSTSNKITPKNSNQIKPSFHTSDQNLQQESNFDFKQESSHQNEGRSSSEEETDENHDSEVDNIQLPKSQVELDQQQNYGRNYPITPYHDSSNQALNNQAQNFNRHSTEGFKKSNTVVKQTVDATQRSSQAQNIGAMASQTASVSSNPFNPMQQQTPTHNQAQIVKQPSLTTSQSVQSQISQQTQDNKKQRPTQNELSKSQNTFNQTNSNQNQAVVPLQSQQLIRGPQQQGLVPQSSQSQKNIQIGQSQSAPSNRVSLNQPQIANQNQVQLQNLVQLHSIEAIEGQPYSYEISLTVGNLENEHQNPQLVSFTFDKKQDTARGVAEEMVGVFKFPQSQVQVIENLIKSSILKTDSIQNQHIVNVNTAKKESPQKISKDQAFSHFNKLYESIEQFFQTMQGKNIGTINEIVEAMDGTSDEFAIRTEFLNQVLLAKRGYKKNMEEFKRRQDAIKLKKQNDQLSDANGKSKIHTQHQSNNLNQADKQTPQQQKQPQVNIAINNGATQSDSQKKIVQPQDSMRKIGSNQDMYMLASSSHDDERKQTQIQQLQPTNNQVLTFKIPDFVRKQFKVAPAEIQVNQKLQYQMRKVQDESISDPEVKGLQNMLNLIFEVSVIDMMSQKILSVENQNIVQNYIPLRIDGFFGDKTETQVMKFQRHIKVQDDGIVSEQIWSTLISYVDHIIKEEQKKQQALDMKKAAALQSQLQQQQQLQQSAQPKADLIINPASQVQLINIGSQPKPMQQQVKPQQNSQRPQQVAQGNAQQSRISPNKHLKKSAHNSEVDSYDPNEQQHILNQQLAGQTYTQPSQALNKGRYNVKGSIQINRHPQDGGNAYASIQGQLANQQQYLEHHNPDDGNEYQQ